MNSQYVVAKFGGTSVADFEAMSRCAHIVRDNPNVRVVVVSACAGVTNHLVTLTQQKEDEAGRKAVVAAVENIQQAIIDQVSLDADLAEGYKQTFSEFENLASLPALSRQQCDEMLSFGERFSSYLFTQILRNNQVQASRFDVRKVLKTDNQFGKANPNVAATREAAQTNLVALLGDTVQVTQGFIGSDQYGQTTTLGRGGSDYSAALLAEAIDASSVHIWTDVVGIFSTDPRLCVKARPIPRLSFDEAAEMATFGAKVLHPATILPASRKGISVFVGSSRDPQAGGTWIEKEKTAQAGIRAVTQRKNQILLTLKSPEMLLASGFLARIFTILSNYNISVDLVTTSEISVALTLDNAPNASRPELEQACLDELGEFCHVTVENNLTLVAMIGSEIQLKKCQLNLMDVLSEFNIRLICHGASKHNLCFLVEQQESDQVVQSIHAKLLEVA
ncbi:MULTISPECIES: lysine-sensitive aspartokinase 3 [Pseudoalteromonas]|uniref:Aspartokinase n=1 Tax=Pseudoalteromonas maricaloris TaxID=184924 RepID=A0A8I2H9K6_9GAMM|nr:MULTISPECIES: lysine-sensitive aspartokinase 3 [Pseudoalteromonas]NLR21465.1 lysine-sensitive aspartokinase 3 [Pseudoalteromonas maricaloris]QUI63271.1 lysine-sensitive aspartokinase 3 [Pseudoalteromonas sp. A22]QZO14288.1 lysine-sensitive aspartokinase 3 [Pseudoalteromonas piscicida]USE68936.1 lysine-sensitive aspartokinase 3 [Pseudoalteromonas flavipulchra]WMO13864.1 lysine-sensitive aspartokinase 3 [Pseudoalteromonas piscicida]